MTGNYLLYQENERNLFKNHHTFKKYVLLEIQFNE